MSKLLDSICSGLQTATESIVRDLDSREGGQDSVDATPIEIYAFLLQWFSTAAERHTPKQHDSDHVAASTKTKVSRFYRQCISKNTEITT